MRLLAAALLLALLSGLALAQDAPPAPQDPAQEDSPLGSFIARKLAPGEDINKISAKRLFGLQGTPAKLHSAAIGFYSKGCMAGAVQLPITGPTWQAMRLSRNRNWGLPQLVEWIEKTSAEAKEKAGWNGFLVGDMAQPRGGPMLSGHASHQIGLDADIWFTPMPKYELSADEREKLVPFDMIKDHATLNTETWTESRAKLLKLVAEDPQVQRIFVHPPIKREMCRWAGGKGAWLAKLRPYYNHTYHFHVRLRCPAGMTSCESQNEVKPKDGTGCGQELAYWYSPRLWIKHPPVPGVKQKPPPPPLTLKGLPAQCRAVIAAP